MAETDKLEAAIIAEKPDENAQMIEALEWYAENARLCRLIHSGGDAGRRALAADGGARARAVLSK